MNILENHEPNRISTRMGGRTNPVSVENSSALKEDNTNDFSNFMRTALEGYGKKQVSEEELFAVLIEQRLQAVSGESAEHYSSERANQVNAIRRGDGYVNMEKAAINALNKTVDAGMITKEEGERILGEAFTGAQLDDNHDELWDDRGSENDPTIAVASVDEALSKVELFLKGLNSGELDSSQRSLHEGPTGHNSVNGTSGSSNVSYSGDVQSQDINSGFLWKPVSESDGKLVVLLPEALRNVINNVEIHSSLPPTDITKLADGRFAGDTMNGNRPHFRFDKEGSSYGDNVHVVAHKEDGSILTWDISKGGSRHE